MHPRRTSASLLGMVLLTACAAPRAQTPAVRASVDVETSLRALEAAKWHPATIGRDSVARLFADDMLSVEYGADPMGLVTRAAATREGANQLYDVLNATQFTLSEWKALRPSADVVLLSYRVSAPALSWTAYATSVWALRHGRWQTVFYQASRARPAGADSALRP